MALQERTNAFLCVGEIDFFQYSVDAYIYSTMIWWYPWKYKTFNDLEESCSSLRCVEGEGEIRAQEEFPNETTRTGGSLGG